MSRLGTVALAIIAGFLICSSSQAGVILDNFNTSEGHFTSNVFNASGSDSGLASTSTHALDATTSEEGGQSQKISLDASTTTPRLRDLSGAGTPSSNITFATGAGVDGWIGLYVKTSAPGWNLQIYMEPSNVAPASANSNGSVPKNLTSDGQWHLYEWNLDDNAGDADGWGSVAGIITGSPTVADGNHTIDSLLFRNPSATVNSNSVFNIDFFAVGDATNPHVDAFLASLPEPASLGLLMMAMPALIRRKR